MKKSVGRFWFIIFISSLLTSIKLLFVIAKFDFSSFTGVALMIERIIILYVYAKCIYEIFKMKMYIYGSKLTIEIYSKKYMEEFKEEKEKSPEIL